MSQINCWSINKINFFDSQRMWLFFTKQLKSAIVGYFKDNSK